ncbi:MAG TPA: cupin domain-containing protein [Candidatus Kryptonia bacterium]|nr:cupin domain-containing protein [Candidatus Kryptonia bacterium]
MRVVDFSRQGAEPVTLFDSVSAASVHVADGAGEAHVHCVYFAPGGQIGPHAAGFGQLFMVVNGEGWAAGADGRRVPLVAGQGAYFSRGEVHSKGSETGMTAIMVQVAELNPA